VNTLRNSVIRDGIELTWKHEAGLR